MSECGLRALASVEDVDGDVGVLAESGLHSLAKAVPWTPVRILGIVVVALVVRWIVFRLIRGLVAKAAAFSPHPRLASTRSGRLLLDSAGLLAERRRERVQTLGSTLRSLASFTIGVLALLAILSQLGMKTLPAGLAGASIVAAAVAFGAQQIVRDFLSGAFLLVEDQYGVGDSVDLGVVSGKIESVGLRITQVRDDQGVVWYVRNGDIVKVGNRSQGWATAKVDVPLAVDADIEQARGVLTAVATGLRQDEEWAQDLLADPVVTGPEEFAVDHVLMRITVRTAPGDSLDVERELRTRIAATLPYRTAQQPGGSSSRGEAAP